MVTSKKTQTKTLHTHYLECGNSSKELVVLLHGNVSSALFFKPLMETFTGEFHFVAPDMRGYGDSEIKPVDATRGVKDFSDDLHAFIEAVNTTQKQVHLIGWSLGGSVIMQYAIDHPKKIASLTLLSPMSPFGFGASRNKGIVLETCSNDSAGCGGGAVSPNFIDCLRTRDGEIPSEQPELLRCNPQSHARATMNGLYFKMVDQKTLLQRGIINQAIEDLYTESMFKTKLGDGNYPGTSQTSTNWPGMAPGTTGVNNAISPKYCNLSAFAKLPASIPVLWIRGADDAIVSDNSLLDVNNLGKMGIIPGWPGEATHPAQPMVTQTRAVLDEYKKNGGSYTEVVFDHCGHSPHIEYQEKFKQVFFDFIK